MTGFVSEEDKEFLYRNAEAFLFPSFYEGLGLPVIESLSVGTPVITARNSSLIEVGGNVSYYVDPADDDNQIATFMNLIYSMDQEDKSMLAEKCKKQARKFNKEECAQSLLEEFETIMSLAN